MDAFECFEAFDGSSGGGSSVNWVQLADKSGAFDFQS